MKTTFPLILAWIWIWIAAVEGRCGWTKAVKEKEVNFNWDSHSLEIKTEEITSRSSRKKQLEVVFKSGIDSEVNVLKMRSFYLTQDMNGYDEILYFGIMLSEKSKQLWIRKPLGELRWTIKKNKLLNRIIVTLAGTALVENFKVTTTEGFQFSSEDTMSLSYRVKKRGHDGCVKSGNVEM